MDEDESRKETLLIPVGGSGRLDQWLASVKPDVSRSQWQRLLREKAVLLDGKAVEARVKVRPDQRVEIDLDRMDDYTSSSEKPPVPERLSLEILWEDESLLAINKSPGMVVHPGNGCSSGTVVNAALNYCGSLPNLGDPQRPGVVHRIDKETSGILLIAKTEVAGKSLQRAFREREIEKWYLTVVQGDPENESGTIISPIGRHPVARTRMAVVEGGKPAISHWEVLRRSEDNWTTLLVKIETGRTHQIRVHLSSIGCPVLGDKIYGFRKSRVLGDAMKTQRVLLHAWRLSMKHPLDGRPIELKAPVPEDLALFMPPEPH